ncbi:hypothetical protein B0J12DRAFT_737379 [Macrophomina phaseolina]|uniref:SANT domain DNA binding protein n=1 Tax=Macrophomina phaseolina TaxID=35725 RepID=A0ABQ8GK11_9PEZI|nr:hypothetical protein B0J12DRAFT_737379 [Macrophomina phaseolina]
MGNTSSQVQDEATDASQLLRPRTPPKPENEDDAAASSQLGSELQTAVAPAPEKDRPEKKSRKSKKEKRKSRDAVPDVPTDDIESSAPQAIEGLLKKDGGNSSARTEDADTDQAVAPQAERPNPRESKKKKKDKNAARDAPTIEAAGTMGGVADVTVTESAGGDQSATKKRKRRSEDVAATNNQEISHAGTSIHADATPAESEKASEDQSHKKQRKSSRPNTGGASTQAKNTPIPIPTFKPPVTKDLEATPTRKSKRKAEAAEAAKNNQAERAPTPTATAPSSKDKRPKHADESATKDPPKKQKKSKKSTQVDSATSSAAQDIPIRHGARDVELSVIDPALLPPPQQEALPGPIMIATEETSGQNRPKRSKKSQNGIAPADVPPESQRVSANGIFGDTNGTEATGERSYLEHQKKKQKRKRQDKDAAPPAAAQPQSHPSMVEPKSKKRKKAAEKEGGAADGSAGSSSKSARSEGSEDFPSSGPYTKKEVETLTRAIEAYREFNDLTQIQVNDIVQAGVFSEVHGKSCKAFWDEVCPCLPNRWSRETIIKFVRRKWHNFDKRGKWDPEEDQMLKDAYAKTPGQWTKIGEAVGRFADDCRDRWRNYLSCSDTMASKRWHDSEVNELLNVVQDCLNTLLERLPEDKKNYWREELQSTERRDIWKPDEIRNLVRKMPDCMDALRQAFDEKHPRESKQKRATEKRRGSSATDGSVVINWDLVSEKMGKKRSRLQIMSKWKALEHSYSQDPKETFFTEANHWRVENGQKWAEQMLPGDKYNIVRAMMDLGLTNEERIIWNSVAHHELVKLKWAHQAKMTFLSMKELVPKGESLPHLLQSLKEYFEKHHENELDNHWRYEGRPGRGSLKSGTKSPGPLDWRGHMRGESSYKSNARVMDDDDEGDDDDMKMEQ